MTPTDRTQARAIALRYVRKLLAQGYDAASAAVEIAMGYAGPGECGYEIRHGEIAVPCYGTTTYTFPFAEIEAEARGPQQLDLFQF